MSARPLHPLVEAWERSESGVAAVLAAYDGPRPPVIAALDAIAAALDGRRPAAEALHAAGAVPLDDPEPDLVILLLAEWNVLAERAGGGDRAWMAGEARRRLRPDAPPGIQAVVSVFEAQAPGNVGHVERQEALRRALVGRLPAGSPGRGRAVADLGFFLAALGRATEIELDLAEAAARTGPASTAVLQRVWFTQFVATGRLAEAERLVGAVSVPDRGPRTLDPRTRGTLTLLRLMQAEVAACPPPPAEDDEPAFARTTRRLLARDAAGALESARAQAARGQGTFELLNGTGFGAWDLVRAELASRNPEAARRLLELRHARGNRDPLDPFFRARCDAGAGRWPEAQAWYREALDAADRLRARGRLDFELALAIELRPGDVSDLAHGSRVAAPPPPAVVATAVPAGAAVGSGRLAGPSPALAEVRGRVERFAGLDLPVLVTGETGTGKELVARALHEAGPRRDAPFVDVNCASLPESLVESELFGHTRGAFTGAHDERPGLFRAAGEGTLFLDEIGEMPLGQQARLLRVLEMREARAVGATAPYAVRCRIVAATNADLTRRAADGSFRPDLLFRLRRLEIELPPLRARRDDIVPLAVRFATTGRASARPVRFSAALERELQRRPWPGNVRELRATIERMRLLGSDADAYDVGDLDRAAPRPEAARDERSGAGPGPPLPPALADGRSAMRRRERLRALLQTHGNLTRQEAAAILGTAPGTAGTDLAALVAEGSARKVSPSRSPRSHYFAWGATGGA